MGVINVETIQKEVARLCMEANYYLGDDVMRALQAAVETETSSLGKDILLQLLENARIARQEQVPMCQDCGMAVVFVELGQDVRIEGGNLTEAINAGVREGYRRGYLRASVVADPFQRRNTGDNTPAVIHYDLVPGNQLKITVAPKGFGSENMSGLRMLKPADGLEGVKRFVIEVVEKAGGNPCPPIIVGVGIGGTMEKAALLAKKALLRPVDSSSEKPLVRELEEELLARINALGIGPQGFGGKTTALGVNVEVFPTHIAGLPVAVNISCHATRHRSAVLTGE